MFDNRLRFKLRIKNKSTNTFSKYSRDCICYFYNNWSSSIRLESTENKVFLIANGYWHKYVVVTHCIHCIQKKCKPLL